MCVSISNENSNADYYSRNNPIADRTDSVYCPLRIVVQRIIDSNVTRIYDRRKRRGTLGEDNEAYDYAIMEDSCLYLHANNENDWYRWLQFSVVCSKNSAAT